MSNQVGNNTANSGNITPFSIAAAEHTAAREHNAATENNIQQKQYLSNYPYRPPGWYHFNVPYPAHDQATSGPSSSTSTGPIRSKRRSRTVFNRQATTFLEAEFERNAYPDYDARCYFARCLGVSEERVQVWCQNRRSRSRGQKLNRGPSNTPLDRHRVSVFSTPPFLNANIPATSGYSHHSQTPTTGVPTYPLRIPSFNTISHQPNTLDTSGTSSSHHHSTAALSATPHHSSTTAINSSSCHWSSILSSVNHYPSNHNSNSSTVSQFYPAPYPAAHHQSGAGPYSNSSHSDKQQSPISTGYLQSQLAALSINNSAQLPSGSHQITSKGSESVSAVTHQQPPLSLPSENVCSHQTIDEVFSSMQDEGTTQNAAKLKISTESGTKRPSSLRLDSLELSLSTPTHLTSFSPLWNLSFSQFSSSE